MADVAARTARQAHYTAFDCLTPSKLVASLFDCRKRAEQNGGSVGNKS